MKKIEIKRICSVSVIDIQNGELIMSFEYIPTNEITERIDVNVREDDKHSGGTGI